MFWEVDLMLSAELQRSLLLALLCILLVVVVMLGSLTAAATVLISVLLTLVNVLGFMHHVSGTRLDKF